MKFFSKGFTLAEILVVVSIIGVLASLIAVNVSSSQQRARDSRRQADLQNISGALELFRATNRSYPVQSSGPVAVDGSILNSTLVPTFLGNLPKDPHPNLSAWQGYTYVTDTTGTKFSLEARLEKSSDGEVTLQSGQYSNSPADDLYYVTGIYKNADSYFYRVSGR